MIKFIYFLLFFIIFQTILAILAQFFGIFYYGVILGINLVAIFCLLFYFLKTGKKIQLDIYKIDWIAFVIIIISIATLYQVHYNYTGKFNMVNDNLLQYHEAKNMRYVYPYFSDEWYAISLVKQSINNRSSPLKNPFDNSFFINPEMFFHSFVAEIMLLFGLDPLTQYTLLSIFINTLIILLAYVFLRINNISKIASTISSLSILYITSAANLPGIWNLMPFTMGVVLSLIGFCFISLDNLKMASLSIIFALLFYPPFFIFWGIGLLAYFLNHIKIYGRNN